MPVRIPWDDYEITLLFEKYREVDSGKSIQQAAQELSSQLRLKATRSGLEIDEKFRNPAGMTFYLLNARYLFTNGERGKGDVQKSVVRLYELMNNEPTAYQQILKEAQRLVAEEQTLAEAFYEYAKQHHFSYALPVIEACLNDAGEFANLKHSVLGEENLNTLKRIRQKVCEGKLLKFRYQSRAQQIRDIVNLYYAFIKGRESLKAQAEQEATTPNLIEEQEDPTEPESEDVKADLDSEDSDPQDSVFDDTPEVRLKGFKTWLKEKELSGRSVYLYWHSIKNAADFIAGHALSLPLLMGDGEQANRTGERLMHMDEFPGVGISHYRAAFNNYAQYLIEKGLPSRCESPNAEDKPASVLREPSCLTEDYLKPSTPQNIDPRYIDILKRFFKKGYRKNSGIASSKFREVWADTFGEDYLGTDDDILSGVSAVCVDTQDFWWLPEHLIGEEDEKLIADYLSTNLTEQSPVLYFKSLYNEICDDLENYILTEDQLEAWLRWKYADKYTFSAEFFSISGAKADIPLEVRKALYQYGKPMPLAALFDQLSHLPVDEVKAALKLSEILTDSTDTYFCADMIQIPDGDLKVITAMIDHSIEMEGYAGFYALIRQLAEKRPDIREEFSLYSDRGLRELIAYQIRHQYNTSGALILPKGVYLNVYHLFGKFAKNHAPMTLTDLEDFGKEIGGYQIGWYPVHENCVRVSETQFVRDQDIDFDVKATDEALALYCENGFISFDEINDMNALPYVIQHPWNTYLLESYVHRFSKRFKLVHKDFLKYGCYGVIVDQQSEFASAGYEEILAVVLAKSNIELKEKAALEYLATHKYIARRKMESLPAVLHQAVLIRTNATK